jgi:DNA-binding NarL/FixJ family response regulator
VNPEQPNSRIRVLVADNHKDLAEAVGEIIASDAALEFVGYVMTGAETIARVRTGGVDVVLLDLSLGDRSGLEVLEQLQAEAPSVRVVMYTGHASPQLAAHARAKGAAAYVLKDADFDALLATLRAV